MWAQAGLGRVPSSYAFLWRVLPADPSRQTVTFAFRNTATNQTEAQVLGKLRLNFLRVRNQPVRSAWATWPTTATQPRPRCWSS